MKLYLTDWSLFSCCFGVRIASLRREETVIHKQLRVVRVWNESWSGVSAECSGQINVLKPPRIVQNHTSNASDLTGTHECEECRLWRVRWDRDRWPGYRLVPGCSRVTTGPESRSQGVCWSDVIWLSSLSLIYQYKYVNHDWLQYRICFIIFIFNYVLFIYFVW